MFIILTDDDNMKCRLNFNHITIYEPRSCRGCSLVYLLNFDRVLEFKETPEEIDELIKIAKKIDS